jgi:hypothetical protein
MQRLDPARTALLVVHMAKGVAGQVDTPFNRLFRERAEKTGVIGVQARLLDGFRTAKAKVVYTLVTYQPGPPAIKPNSPPFRTLVDCNCLLEGTPAVEIIDDLAPGPVNRSPTSPSNPPRVLQATCNTGRSLSPTVASPTPMRVTPTRSRRSRSGWARPRPPPRSSPH